MHGLENTTTEQLGAPTNAKKAGWKVGVAGAEMCVCRGVRGWIEGKQETFRNFNPEKVALFS